MPLALIKTGKCTGSVESRLFKNSAEMNFERSEQLIPILDDLEANDQDLFYGLQQKVLGEKVKLGQEYSLSTVVAVFDAFREQLTERAKKIFSEMVRILDGAYIEDFDNLTEGLKAEWDGRMAATATIASSKTIKSQIADPGLPSETALSEHVEKLKPKWFAEIELFCINLH